MVSFVKIFIVLFLLLSRTVFASHIYNTPLYKLSDEKYESHSVEENKAIIEDVVNKITYIAGIKKVKIQWVDDNPILNTGNGISFTAGKSISVIPDSLEFSIICHSDAANLLDKDELACVISHELGHILGDTQNIHLKMKRLTDNDYIFMWGPYEEMMADKASIALAGISGYNILKFKSGLEKIICSQEGSDLYFIAGQESYPLLLSEYPSYGVRMLRYEAFVKDFFENPRKFYNEVAFPDNFSMANVLESNNFIDFVNDVRKEAKRKISVDEYIQSVLLSDGNAKALAESLLIKELNNNFKEQLYYEQQATKDFFEFIDTLDVKQMERVFDGLSEMHKNELYKTRELFDNIHNENLKDVIDMRYHYMNDIFEERMKYLLKSLREKGKVVEYQFVPIVFDERGIEF